MTRKLKTMNSYRKILLKVRIFLLKNKDSDIKYYLIRNLFRSIYFLIVNFIGKDFEREFFVVDNLRLVYINNPKTACSTIKSTLSRKVDREGATPPAQHLVRSLNKKQLSYFKFTFVRDPYDRLLSCYINKFLQYKERFIYEDYLMGYLKENDSFEDFVRKVAVIPDTLSDEHFRSQYSILYKNNKLIPDYVGRFESLASDFKDIADKYDLGEFDHINKSSNKELFNELYTPELIEIVGKRYAKDFENFGYSKDFLARD